MSPTLLLFAMLAGPDKSPVQAPQFQAPAGNEYARVSPGGTTILPNGRFLTPKGRRLYTGEDLWHAILSPNGKTLAAFHDGGISIWRDVAAIPGNAAKPERTSFGRKNLAPAGAFSHDGKRLVISLGEAGGVEILDAASLRSVAVITANSAGIKDSYINDLVIAPGDKLAYAVDIANQRLVTFDLENHLVSSSARAGRQPYAVAMSDDGKSIFVANIGLFDYSLVPPPMPGSGSSKGISRPAFAFPSSESESGVEFEGRRVPGIGSPYVPDAQSIYQYRIGPDGRPKLARSAKSGILIHAPADAGKSVGGSAPNALLIRGRELFVSNANNDTVQVFDCESLRSLRTIRLSPSPLVARLRGVIPSGMAMNRAGTRLYVCESGLNAVVVVNPKSGAILGHIPTGWFPMQVRLSPDDATLFVATQKGLGRGPRGPLGKRAPSDERYGLAEMPGMVDMVTAPTDVELKSWSSEVLRNNGIVDRARTNQQARNPKMRAVVPAEPGSSSERIEYVVFITKENHTYDGIFGALKDSKGEPDYAEFGQNGWIREKGKNERVPIMPNHIRLAEQFGICDNFYMEPQASGDGHRWLVGVYPSLWTTRVFYAGWDFRRNNEAKGRLVPFGSNGSQIPEDYLENGSLWEHLERGGVPFRNYGEGFEFPEVDEGDTTGKSGAWEPVNFPVPRSIWNNTCWEYPIFNMAIPDIARVEWFKEDLEKNYRNAGKPIPRFMNITLCNDHGTKPSPSTGYPYTCSFMADNDLALGRIVEYLTHLPEWKKMAIFVTQDDSGGDNDHIDRHRSFVLAISPFAKHHYVSQDHTSIMSILKTIYELFGLGPNNMFDALATDLHDMFTDEPDYTPYTHVESDPRVFRPEATHDASDPRFEKRKKQASTVRMDDPALVEWLRNRK